MVTVSLFGKGGIGKSTIACNLSATYAKQGLAVAQIGCDPKADSVSRLVGGRPVPRIVDALLSEPHRLATSESWASSLVVKGLWGTSCLESGGPEPGIGCAGRGVDLALEFLKKKRFFESGFDVVLLDVLGDVVCGGFASPLRRGFGQNVCIVTSEEALPMYAANNIARMVANHARDGARLVGLIVNCRTMNPPRERLLGFAERLGTRVLTFIPTDPLLRAASDRYHTVVEETPDAPISRVFAELADSIREAVETPGSTPTPLSDEEFVDFLGGQVSASTGLSAQMRLVSDASPSVPPPAAQAQPAAGNDAVTDASSLWLEGGPAARAELARILRLPTIDDAPARAGRTSVRAVRWQGQHHLAVDLGADTGERIRILLEEPGDGPYFRRTEHWALHYRLKDVRPGQRRLIVVWLDRLANRLGTTTLSELTSVLGRDSQSHSVSELASLDAQAGSAGPDSGPGPEDEPALPAPPDGEPAPPTWFEGQLGGSLRGGREDWRRYICANRLDDFYSREVQLDFGLSAWDPMIRFGDLECQKPSVSRHLAWPFADELLKAAARRSAHRLPQLRRDLARTIRFADLDHANVIIGSQRKLDGIAASMVGDHPSTMIRFENCCVPLVTGENVEDTLHRVEENARAPIHYHLPSQPHTRLIRYVEEVLAQCTSVPSRANSYNLIGFPESVRVQELIEMLGEFGLHLHQTVLPGPFSADPRHFGEAARFVFLPNAAYQAYFEPILELAAQRAVAPAAPYGIAATREWLKEVAGQFGRANEAGAVWQGAFSRVEEVWEGLRARAATQRIAVVAEEKDLEALVEPRHLGGVDLLGFLQEAGFPVEVVAPPALDPAGEAVRERLRRRLAGARLLEVSREQEWLQLAQSGRYRAIFTNLVIDSRRQQLGLGRFSLFDLEVGLLGAVASLERILHSCSIDFYRKYRAYLGGS